MKKTLLGLTVIACLSMFSAVYPSDDSTSTDSSSAKFSLPSLESAQEDSSWMSGAPSLESLAINRDRQEWWKYISDADRKAYQAEDPETQQKFRDRAQILRNYVESMEELRTERQDNKKSITRTPLPEILDSFEDHEEQDELPESQENLESLED